MISLRGYLATGSGLFSRLLDRKDLRRETVVVLLLAKLQFRSSARPETTAGSSGIISSSRKSTIGTRTNDALLVI